ncbi:MAG: sulfurtransferase [Acidimicrobiales bacterium]
MPAGWLDSHRGEVVVADVRWYLDGRSGAEAFAGGHLPGAVFVDLDTVLCGPPSRAHGRHPLPGPASFAAALGALGIAGGDVVVAYDDAGGTVAGRLVWMLRALGQPAALLDGGIQAWTGQLSRGPEQAPEPAACPARPWPAHRLATLEDVATWTGGRSEAGGGGEATGGVVTTGGVVATGGGEAGGRSVLVDARAPERYRGDVEPVDPRAGHVPGALSVPAVDHLDPATERFRQPEALRARFSEAGIGPGDDVIVYCGSGVTACQGLLALEAAGLGPGRLWPGSWSQWSADPVRAVATGPGP